MSTNDLVSIFLSIELQSYGLYLLSTIYRNSELATTGGLIYFLLGAKGSRIPLYLCLLLPNSGDALKLMILSNVWKNICGWTNYSDIVTSHKMMETEIGNRGSKSSDNKILLVKEQRINGNKFDYLMMSNFRCILMGFERDYRSKVLSKSLNRNYSTNITSSDTSQNKKSKLEPNFVSGFIDGEGSFSVTFIKDKSYKSGWQIKTSFSIGLHKKDLALLEKIKIYFGVGGISQKGVNGVQYYVNSPKDLLII